MYTIMREQFKTTRGSMSTGRDSVKTMIKEAHEYLIILERYYGDKNTAIRLDSLQEEFKELKKIVEASVIKSKTYVQVIISIESPIKIK
jgi:hypothetical protein